MGCTGSKAKETKTAEPGKTLLAAEPASAEALQEVCKTCGNKGRDILGKRCVCSYGQALVGPEVQLKVTIASAQALRNADFVGKSDPYCICEVLGKPDPNIQTAVVSDQLNPAWNFESVLAGYCVGNSLTFTVKDKDVLKSDDILGKATLTTAQIFPDGFEGEIQLTDAGAGVEAFLKVQVAVVHPKVKVTVVGARNLRNADMIGKSDPYCICEVQGKPSVQIVTPSVTDTLNPEWLHEAELVGYQIEDALIFTVKDKDPLKPDDFLGKVSVPFEAFTDSVFEGELQLTETQGELESFLKLKIELGGNSDNTETMNDTAEGTRPVTSPNDAAVNILVEEQASQGKTCFC